MALSSVDRARSWLCAGKADRIQIQQRRDALHDFQTKYQKTEDIPMANKYRDFDDYLQHNPDKNGYFGKYGGAFLPPQL